MKSITLIRLAALSVAFIAINIINIYAVPQTKKPVTTGNKVPATQPILTPAHFEAMKKERAAQLAQRAKQEKNKAVKELMDVGLAAALLYASKGSGKQLSDLEKPSFFAKADKGIFGF